MVLNSGYLTSTNTKNHNTISISTNSHRPAFSKRTVLNALLKLTCTAAWLCNNAFFNLPQQNSGPLFIMILG